MNNKATVRKLIFISIASIGLTGGCAQMEQLTNLTGMEPLTNLTGMEPSTHFAGNSGGFEEESDLTPAQRRLREQSGAFSKTIIQGAVIGAIGGMGVQYLRGKRETEDLIKGAVAGAAAGALSGWYIAERQKGYANQEEQLDTLIRTVRQKNEQTEALVANLQVVVEEDKRKLTRLQQQLDNDEITREQYRQQLASVEQDRQLIRQARDDGNKQLADFRQTRQLYEQDYPGTNTATLSREIETFENYLDAISEASDEMAAIG